METLTEDQAAALLREAIRPGDAVLWSQGTGEPLSLSEAFVAEARSFPGVRLFLGGTFSRTFAGADTGDADITVLGGAGANSRLAEAGRLAVLPCHISSVPGLIERGLIPVDVALIQVAPERGGTHSLGVIADYVREAIDQARVVIAEVNERMPETYGDTAVPASEIDYRLYSDRPLVEIEPVTPGPAEARIGELIAERIPDGATIQVGIGAIPNAVLNSLKGHRELGLHTGAVGDELVDLMQAGVIDNSRKGIDRGVAVTGALFGTERLYRFADRNPGLEVRSIRHTHNPAVIARTGAFFAINGALEVDLTGQVNAETLGGRHVGAVGGQVDFVRAAMASPGGRSIIALPATAAGGKASRIVPRLADGVVTTARSDADLVVTEHGVAELRGCPLHERARRLIAIAAPEFRDELTERARLLC